MDHEEQEPVEIPVDGILDLHQFQPGDVKDLVPDYLDLCRGKRILRVRIIHGKGTGALRTNGPFDSLEAPRGDLVQARDGGRRGLGRDDRRAGTARQARGMNTNRSGR